MGFTFLVDSVFSNRATRSSLMVSMTTSLVTRSWYGWRKPSSSKARMSFLYCFVRLPMVNGGGGCARYTGGEAEKLARRIRSGAMENEQRTSRMLADLFCHGRL